MNQFLRRHATIIETWVALFEDDHATALDPLIIRVDRSSNEISKAHVGDETSTLFNLQERLLALLP